MPRPKGSRTGRCHGCNHAERVRIERFLAAGASVKGAARKFAIDYHGLRRHWGNHVSAEARAVYIIDGGATKDQLEEIVAVLYRRDGGIGSNARWHAPCRAAARECRGSH